MCRARSANFSAFRSVVRRLKVGADVARWIVAAILFVAFSVFELHAGEAPRRRLSTAQEPEWEIANLAEPPTETRQYVDTPPLEELDLLEESEFGRGEDWTSARWSDSAADRFRPLYQAAPGAPGAYTDLEDGVSIDVLARAYYANDQRIQWSGLEATFGAEGILAGGASREVNGWIMGVAGELYLHQPFDRNILVDTPERASYRGNFEYETLELSQLYVHARRGDFLLAAGKMATPFGRTYFPVYHNSRFDAPFIRTESILWRETGMLVQYDPSFWTFTAAVINGGTDRDANSSKGVVGRVGLDGDNFAVGGSIKFHDGIGSENQKIYRNHVGMDAMYQLGRYTISSEVIYDEYGFHRPGFAPNDITWGRSIYYRDQNLAFKKPITGVGYYVDVTYAGEDWLLGINYGQFHPKPIGDPRHDVVTRRGLLRAVRHITKFCDLYATLVFENEVENAQDGRLRSGRAFLFGLQIAI